MQLPKVVAVLSTVALAMAAPPEVRGHNDKRIDLDLSNPIESIEQLDSSTVGVLAGRQAS